MNLRTLVDRVLASGLFSRRAHPATAFEVIKWWELRRVPYNLIVGATGILTFAAIFGIAAVAPNDLGPSFAAPDPPFFAFLFSVFAYGFCANVCYTGGWAAELLARLLWKEKSVHFAEISFSLGLLFSIALTLAPAVFFAGWVILHWIFR